MKRKFLSVKQLIKYNKQRQEALKLLLKLQTIFQDLSEFTFRKYDTSGSDEEMSYIYSKCHDGCNKMYFEITEEKDNGN